MVSESKLLMVSESKHISLLEHTTFTMTLVQSALSQVLL